MYRDVLVGRVVQTDTDFPRCVGTVAVEKDVAKADPSVARFINLSAATSRIEDQRDGMSEYPESPELSRFEEHYNTMDPDAWWLVAPDGTREPIICPNIRHDGSIIWGWDVDRETVRPGRP